ncbi:hypothetical protein Syun_012052 [Stephania yunnanensis]|uniref:Uncharacterized protein n=1 Tax=Stephania yunnanensis TaxID=152371 RepID=A0AAP0K169_9MAGN
MAVEFQGVAKFIRNYKVRLRLRMQDLLKTKAKNKKRPACINHERLRIFDANSKFQKLECKKEYFELKS